MAGNRNGFLSRWSTRKLAATRPDAVPERNVATADGSLPADTQLPADAPLPELSPLDQLTPDSDFSGFMNAKVDDAVRRLALKKLFTDPRLNIVDGLDDYAEDYTLMEALAPGVAEQLAHARTTLFGPDPTPIHAQVADRAPANLQPQAQAQQQLAATEPIRPDASPDSPDTPDASDASDPDPASVPGKAASGPASDSAG